MAHVERDRAWRRQMKQRKREKVKRFLALTWWRMTREEIEERSCRMADNPKTTQCNCCCNPRRNRWTKKFDKLTMQEKRLFLSKNKPTIELPE